MLSLAEQRICVYCSFCEPVRSVVVKANFVRKSVYAGHWYNIWHSSSVDVIQSYEPHVISRERGREGG